MSQDKGKTPCDCEGRQDANRTMSYAAVQKKSVIANIPQDIKTNINIQILRGRDLGKLTLPRPICKPRGNKKPSSWDLARPALSDLVVGKLQKADKTVVDWLEKSPANRELFMANPVAAIAEAGVKLERAERKELVRAAAATREAITLSPGMEISEINVTANPRGKIGSFNRTPNTLGKVEKCGPAKTKSRKTKGE